MMCYWAGNPRERNFGQNAQPRNLGCAVRVRWRSLAGKNLSEELRGWALVSKRRMLRASSSSARQEPREVCVPRREPGNEANYGAVELRECRQSRETRAERGGIAGN